MLTHFKGPIIEGEMTRLTANTVLDATTDAYKTFITSKPITITMPAADQGLAFTIIYDGPDGEGGLRLDNVSGGSIYLYGDIVADKYIENTAATSKRGDSVHLYTGHHTAGWAPVKVVGTWVKEA